MTADGSGALILPPDPPAPATGPHSASPGDLIDGLDSQSDPVVLADLLRYARTTRKDWLAAEQAIETRLAEVAGVGQHEPAPGSVFIVRSGSRNPKWDTDDLKRLVVARGRDMRRVDRETGEALESEGEAVGRAIWTALGTNPNWTVGGLKELDIPASEYRTVEDGRRTVEVIGG